MVERQCVICLRVAEALLSHDGYFSVLLGLCGDGWGAVVAGEIRGVVVCSSKPYSDEE